MRLNLSQAGEHLDHTDIAGLDRASVLMDPSDRHRGNSITDNKLTCSCSKEDAAVTFSTVGRQAAAIRGRAQPRNVFPAFHNQDLGCGAIRTVGSMARMIRGRRKNVVSW